MFKWLSAVYKKDCFLNCNWIDSLRKERNRFDIENRLLLQYKHICDTLQYFNNRYEDIMLFDELNGKNVILTIKSGSDLRGIPDKFTIAAYIINESETPRNIVTFDAAIHYRRESGHIDFVFIIDFLCKIENEGYGSFVFTHILKYIKTLGCNAVKGVLSQVDFNRKSEHKNLLHHFYEKFGFKIENNLITLNLYKGGYMRENNITKFSHCYGVACQGLCSGEFKDETNEFLREMLWQNKIRLADIPATVRIATNIYMLAARGYMELERYDEDLAILKQDIDRVPESDRSRLEHSYEHILFRKSCEISWVEQRVKQDVQKNNNRLT